MYDTVSTPQVPDPIKSSANQSSDAGELAKKYRL